MDEAQITRIESSFAAVAIQGQALVKRFYEHLFTSHPSVRPLFPEDMTEQEGKLLASIALVVSSLRSLGGLTPLLQSLGRRHITYGAQPLHYGAVRDCLLATLAELGQDVWNEQLTQDWHAAIDLVAQTMLSGPLHRPEPRHAKPRITRGLRQNSPPRPSSPVRRRRTQHISP